MEEGKIELVTCNNCDGTGYTVRLQSYGIFNNWVKKECFECKGTGKIKKEG